MAKTQIKIGSFCLVRQKAPTAKWVEGDLSSRWRPVWAAKLKLPGDMQSMTSTGFKLCAKCLEDERPTQNRKDCACQKPARKYAQDILDAEAHKWVEKRTEAVTSWKRRREELLFAPVKEAWERNVPTKGRENYIKRMRRLEAMVEQATGKDFEGFAVGAWTWDLTLDWIQMRQEYGRQGWSQRGTLPEGDAWQILRTRLREKTLPPIDKTTVAAWNTTIKTHINDARSILGKTGRSEYLRGLELPPLTDFLEGKIKLPVPMGHREIEAADYKAMYDAAEGLKETDLQLWVTLQMMWRFGSRPIEVWKARPHWIEQLDGGPVLVLTNREAEGFSLKAAERNIERRIRVPLDLWDAIQKVQTAEAIIGGSSPTATRNLVERKCSQWVRKFLSEEDYGSHSNYMLRHYIGRLVSRRHGSLMASLYLGHSTEATLANRRATVTETRYSEGGGSEILPAITWEDVRPE